MSLFKRCFDLFNEFHGSAQYFNFVSVVSQARRRRQTEGKDKQSENPLKSRSREMLSNAAVLKDTYISNVYR